MIEVTVASLPDCCKPECSSELVERLLAVEAEDRFEVWLDVLEHLDVGAGAEEPREGIGPRF
jgi:hypothetical protein